MLEQTRAADPDRGDRPVNHYAARHLERFPPGTPYPEVFARVAALFAHPPLAGATLIWG